MRRRQTGKYAKSVVSGETVQAFIPDPLPPKPPLAPDADLAHRMNDAHVKLGRLDGVAGTLPDTHLFLYAYVRKEAVLSSQIEGTQSSLSDLLLFELEEAPGTPLDDVIEVSNYVAAMEHGLARVRGGFPLSNRLIREMHRILLARGRGRNSGPGEFRRSQNWIGGTRPGNARFVPPPHSEVEPCMADLERFLHDQPERTATLLKAAMAHVQFETIHPFLDGNGRVGRLMITLLLCIEGVLREPLLYLSLFLKQNRSRYYELLGRVRTEGDWEEWVRFFMTGVAETAEQAVATAQRLGAIAKADRVSIQGTGRIAGSALRVHHHLLERPISTIAAVAGGTKLSVPTVTKALNALERLELVSEVTGRKRGRIFRYDSYLDELQRGTEPLP